MHPFPCARLKIFLDSRRDSPFRARRSGAAVCSSSGHRVERLCVHRAGTLVLGSSPTRAALLVLVSRACLV